MNSNKVKIFTDGACSGNPGPGGWGSIILMPDWHVNELGGGLKQTTNNQMEMTAAIETLSFILKNISKSKHIQSVEIYTDSVYVIRGITQWIWGWQKNNWKTAEGESVGNQELWVKLQSIVMKFKEQKVKLNWHYVRGHVGIPGNERCDEIAVAFSKSVAIKLYIGDYENYWVDLEKLPQDTSLPPMKDYRDKSNQKAPLYYLSLINGVLKKHSSWKECEAEVKGKSGAKFKKIMSEQELDSTLLSWKLKK